MLLCLLRFTVHTGGYGVLDIARLPTVQWTRAPPDRTGRHPCTPADSGGTHFEDNTPARKAHIQQLLHAIALTAADRPGWQDTEWYRDTYGNTAACRRT